MKIKNGLYCFESYKKDDYVFFYKTDKNTIEKLQDDGSWWCKIGQQYVLDFENLIDLNIQNGNKIFFLGV